MALSLVSLNVEQDKHFDLIIPFLQKRMPDVFCAQEMYEHDVPRIAEALGSASHAFAPMMHFLESSSSGVMGTALFSRAPIRKTDTLYYKGDPNTLPEVHWDKEETWNNKNLNVLFADVEKDSAVFRIGVTHFTWSMAGEATNLQREDLTGLLTALDGLGECVFCGDLNAPRGGEIFGTIAERYHDNIPANYIWSVDVDMHRAGRATLERHAREAGYAGFMVDALFTTPGYAAFDVQFVSGVSDHMAVVANISHAGA